MTVLGKWINSDQLDDNNFRIAEDGPEKCEAELWKRLFPLFCSVAGGNFTCYAFKLIVIEWDPWYLPCNCNLSRLPGLLIRPSVLSFYVEMVQTVQLFVKWHSLMHLWLQKCNNRHTTTDADYKYVVGGNCCQHFCVIFMWIEGACTPIPLLRLLLLLLLLRLLKCSVEF